MSILVKEEIAYNRRTLIAGLCCSFSVHSRKVTVELCSYVCVGTVTSKQGVTNALPYIIHVHTCMPNWRHEDSFC